MLPETAERIAGNLAMLVDPRVGIISRLEEPENEVDAPDFVQIVARGSDASALGGAGGRGLTTGASADRDGAITTAMAKGIARYCAALYDRESFPLASHSAANFARIVPPDFALFSQSQYARPGFPFSPFEAETPVRWTSVVDLATGEEVRVPAPFVWLPYPYFRNGGELPIVPANAAGLGCAHGLGAAALAGLCDVVARDALALFWHASITPPQVGVASLPPHLRDLVARFEATGDRVAILDIASDNRVPTFAAALSSSEPERPAFVLAGAADLDPSVAIANALSQVAETARMSRQIMRRRPPPAATSEWEDLVDPEDHLNFAANHRNRALFEFALSSEEQRDFPGYENLATGAADADLRTAVGRVLASGRRAYAANLTSEDIDSLGLKVCRVLVPGYQPLFAGHRIRALGGTRLYDVPQKLGYRGVTVGRANPAPHPFL